MSKQRVYELARELNVESKVLVTKAKAIGISVASHQSTLTGDDVTRLKEVFGGGNSGTAAAKPRTVIRRRRKAVEPQPIEAEASSEAAATPGETSPKADVEPIPEAKPEPAPEAQPAESLGDLQPAKATPVEEPVAPAPEPLVEPAPQESAPKVAKKRDGATIVRRATPEEQEQLESVAARKRQTGRKEDHRGTRVTGIGLLTNRVGVSDGDQTAGPSNEEFSGSEETSAWANRRSAKPGVKKPEEEEPVRARQTKQRRANAAFNQRALLEQAQLVQLEDTTDGIVSEYKGRTVYTPSASQRKRDLKRRKDLKKTSITTPRAAYRVVKMGNSITVGELAKQLAVKSGELIKKLMDQGVMATINEELDQDTATLMASEYKFEVKSTSRSVEDILRPRDLSNEALVVRAPIVTVMGHVDHGKTSILDAIKQSDVAAGEAGGITQHIGAYSIDHGGKKITFLDTPGHEAFSSMRARGAQVTDIVILVVAADDGVMPQTVEAISHAKDAGVPMIVAVNKMDKPNTNVDRIFTELTEHGVQAEEWGGETQFIKCSAVEKTGIDELLEAVSLQAEILELKATSDGFAEGVVIEAHLDKGRGPVATIVVQNGTLAVGDFVVAGAEVGRVRGMYNHLGQELKVAGPSDAAEITGLSGVPMAGDQLNSVDSEKTSREAAEWRIEHAQIEASRKSSAASLEDLLNKVKSEDVPEVPFIIKGDTQGSVEAVSDSIMKIKSDKVRNRIVHAGVGGITESDISLAATSGAILIAFQVRAARGLDELAEKQGVMIHYFSIIYDIVDAVKAVMVGTLPPIVNEVFLGRAEVRKPISVPKAGTVAGSAVVDGKITRNSHCRLIRDDIVVFEGKLHSLRRFKEDVKEVQSGYECGISIDGYNDIKEGDVIEAFTLEEHSATL